jgi:hypothetical protein
LKRAWKKFFIRFSGLTRDVPGKGGGNELVTQVQSDQGADCVTQARLFMEHELRSLTTKSLSSMAPVTGLLPHLNYSRKILQVQNLQFMTLRTFRKAGTKLGLSASRTCLWR